MLSQADEVVLIDLTPEALIERLRDGQGLPAGRVPAALNGFFRIENLEALREVALRQVAEDVEAKRLRGDVVRPRARTACSTARRRRRSASGCWRSSSRSPSRSASCAARGARRSGSGPSSTCSVVPAREPAAEEREQLDALRRLASLLGAQVLVEEGDDVAERGRRVAASAAPTYVLIGRRRRAAASAGSGSRCRTADATRCPASTCGSSPTARSGGRRMTATSCSRSPRSPVGAGLVLLVRRAPRRRRAGADRRAPRILFPFTGSQLSTPALDAALRLARAENATLVPAYLAPVPMTLPLRRRSRASAAGRCRCSEAIEHRAAAAGVPVDAPHRAAAAPSATRCAQLIDARALRPHRRRRRPGAYRRPQLRRRRLAARARSRRGCRAAPGRRGRARGGVRHPANLRGKRGVAPADTNRTPERGTP